MSLRTQVGQGIILAILCVGALMASLVIFGAKRGEDVATLVQKFDASQAAFEALASAAKRVQYMYAVESGCDPATLDTRLSKMNHLPDLGAVGGADDLGIQNAGRASYVTAVPRGSGAATRQNRCVSTTAEVASSVTVYTGCRQFAVPVDNQFYIVTAGQVIRDAGPRATDCPRDAAVRLSTVVGGNVFFQKFSLTNICSLANCTCTDVGSCAAYDRGFAAQSVTNSSTLDTIACTNLSNTTTIASRKYGSIAIGGSTTSVTHRDLRWARRYLETGSGAFGDTSFLSYTGTAPAGDNATCHPTNSSSQCKGTNCVPAFDLNRDGANNEADLAILENWLRGYVNRIPVIEIN